MGKEAKLAHKKKAAPERGDLRPRSVQLCDSTGVVHRISRNVTGKTDCGLRVNDKDVRDPRRVAVGTSAWYFGTADDVTCGGCSGVA
jgi:hypothetical protein